MSDAVVPDYDPHSVEARLSWLVGHLNRRLVSATGGLSHGLLTALASVSRSGPLRIAELGALESVSAPGITRIVADLESRGLVSRSPDPDDGRAVLVSVTPEGDSAVRRARLARIEVIGHLVGDSLDPREIDAISAALPALEKLIGGGQPPEVR